MYLGAIVEVVAVRRALRQPAAPVHDVAALGDPDPGSRGRARPQADPARRRPAEPGQSAQRRAASTRAARTCRTRAAATRCRRFASSAPGHIGRLPLGRADQGGRAASRSSVWPRSSSPLGVPRSGAALGGLIYDFVMRAAILAAAARSWAGVKPLPEVSALNVREDAPLLEIDTVGGQRGLALRGRDVERDLERPRDVRQA